MSDIDPIGDYAAKMELHDIHLTPREALSIDLSGMVLKDFKWRWENNSDVALNITGKPGLGKSNMLLFYGMSWCGITGRPYSMSSIAYDVPSYNLLLKGFKIKPVENDDTRIEVVEFDSEPGSHLSLDEAGDVNRTGPLAMTALLQTTDLEKRMRARQIGRFCAGVGEILHQAYYYIQAIERNPKEKICTGLLYVYSNGKKRFLGSVRVPYVDKSIYEKYNKPKMKSIKDYGRGASVNRIAQLIDFFAEELRNSDEFQALPIKPPNQRLNWIMRNPKYSIFTANKYFEELERLSRPEKKEKERDEF